ncbi:MAG: fibronectin type III domain-containing protein [Actinomycetota bacterium]|nr:fibronectin type III domain-containing protein [Actinomycetota bacterium]
MKLTRVAATALLLFGMAAAAPTASADSPLSFLATPLNGHSVVLSWTHVSPDPVQARIERQDREGRWRLIDTFSIPPFGTYTDHLLWENTRYRYRLSIDDDDGRTLAEATAEVATGTRIGPFPRFYSSSSFWNQPIASDAPSDRFSKQMVRDSLVTFAREHQARVTGRRYPAANFAMTNGWGVPIAFAHPLFSREYEIGCTRYDCETDVRFRIPRYAALTEGSDSRLSVINPAEDLELDMWAAEFDAQEQAWRAGSRYVTSTSPLTGQGAVCDPGEHCNSAVAAGFSALGGVIRPEEVAQGQINHALALTTPLTRRNFIACPATHTDGNTRWRPSAGTYPIPQGARLQLDPEFDIPESWPSWRREIAEALQIYGALVVDTGGSLAIKGEATSVTRGYDSWGLVGLPEGADRSLDDFPWERMRVLKVERNRGDGTCGG